MKCHEFSQCSSPTLSPHIVLPRGVLQPLSPWISRVLYPLSHRQGQKCSLCARLNVGSGVKSSRLRGRGGGQHLMVPQCGAGWDLGMRCHRDAVGMLYSSETLPLALPSGDIHGVVWNKGPLASPSLVWTGPPTGLLATLQIEQLEEGTSLIIPITVTCWLQGTLAVMGSGGMK